MIPKRTNIFPTKINSLEKLLPFVSLKKLYNRKIFSLWLKNLQNSRSFIRNLWWN